LTDGRSEKKNGLFEAVSRVGIDPKKGRTRTRRVNRKSPIPRKINEFSFHQGILQPTTPLTSNHAALVVVVSHGALS